ncbi:MAG: hypothetical protein WBX15_11265 [Thermoanaerobaculia bacterium]
MSFEMRQFRASRQREILAERFDALVATYDVSAISPVPSIWCGATDVVLCAPIGEAANGGNRRTCGFRPSPYPS